MTLIRFDHPPHIIICKPFGRFLSNGKSKNKTPGEKIATHLGKTVNPQTKANRITANPTPIMK